MNIVVAYPPNFEKINEKFHPPYSVVFTYGDTLYNPGNGHISTDLLAHEKTHTHQQGDKPEWWWDRYIDNGVFRLNQEVEAYRNQLASFSTTIGYLSMMKRLVKKNQFLARIASDLSSSIYGNIVSYEEAIKLITGEKS